MAVTLSTGDPAGCSVMARFCRPLLLVSLALAVPIVPFWLAGDWFESLVAGWLDNPPSREAIAGGVTLLLACDVLLPIPSGPISAWAGGQLGVLFGAAVVWTGMTAGAVLAFALARRFGPPLAARWIGEEDQRRMENLAARHGSLTLALTRALPVLAEASVLLLGVQRLSWGKFLAPVLLSNLGIALAYTAFGDWASQHQWLPAALALSIALPLLALLAARKAIRGGSGQVKRSESNDRMEEYSPQRRESAKTEGKSQGSAM